MIRYKSTTNHWFVSVDTPKHLRLRLFSSAVPRARETKSFPTEIEAKQFAKAMLSEGRKVTAGTLSTHQPIRRTVTASEINQWIEGSSGSEIVVQEPRVGPVPGHAARNGRRVSCFRSETNFCRHWGRRADHDDWALQLLGHCLWRPFPASYCWWGRSTAGPSH